MSYVYRRQLMVPWKARKGDPREVQWRKRSARLGIKRSRFKARLCLEFASGPQGPHLASLGP